MGERAIANDNVSAALTMLGVLFGLYLIASIGSPYLVGLSDPPSASAPAAVKKSGDKAKIRKTPGAARQNKEEEVPSAAPTAPPSP